MSIDLRSLAPQKYINSPEEGGGFVSGSEQAVLRYTDNPSSGESVSLVSGTVDQSQSWFSFAAGEFSISAGGVYHIRLSVFPQYDVVAAGDIGLESQVTVERVSGVSALTFTDLNARWTFAADDESQTLIGGKDSEIAVIPQGNTGVFQASVLYTNNNNEIINMGATVVITRLAAF